MFFGMSITHSRTQGTELGRHMKSSDLLYFLVRIILNPGFFVENFKSIPQGAATTLRCVSMTDHEIQGGHYYYNCNSGDDDGELKGICVRREYEDYQRQSPECRLWELSEQLIRAKGFQMTLQ